MSIIRTGYEVWLEVLCYAIDKLTGNKAILNNLVELM